MAEPTLPRAPVAAPMRRVAQDMQAVVEIQKRLPNARVMYVSATGATEAENLCYMTRLGLWGDKTAFRNKLDFVSMLQQRGVGELLTQHSSQSAAMTLQHDRIQRLSVHLL